MKTNFLQFDALQIKQSIYEVLQNDARYNGYLYLDTKLSAFVDVIAASHETLMFYLNNQVADSVFSSTQNDSNMIGIVKLIDYHAKGMIPSTVDAKVYPTSGVYTDLGFSFVIPKEAYYYDTARSKYWSPVQDYTIGNKLLPEGTNITFICGRWVDSGGRWVTNGSPSQIIELTAIDTTIVGWPYLDVYINGEKWTVTYDKSIERYMNIDSSTNKIVELNINENLKYFLRFGDGVDGAIPPVGSIIIIKYLSSTDGTNGRIAGNKMVDLFNGTTQTAFKNMVVTSNTGLIDNWTTIASNLSSTNAQQTTLNFGSDVENADSIRVSAPQSVYANDKLVRSADYKNYILANYSNIVSDIAVQNNFEFASTFYSWLDQYALLDWNVRKYGFSNLGSNDSGNVYLWFAGSSNNTDYTRIIDNISPIVANGQNPVAMTGAEQFIQFGFYNSTVFGTLTTTQIIDILAAGNQFKIIIKKNSTSSIDNSTIKNNVINIILSYFSSRVRKFGVSVSTDTIVNNIKKISGVDSVGMRLVNNGTTISSISGLSFATWNINYLNGADLTINSGLNYNTSDIIAEPFMYFSFVNTLVVGSMIVVESGR